MIIPKTKNKVTTLKKISVALFLVFALAANPLIIQANTAEKELTPFKKFQIELFGGYAPLDPSDMNLYVDYDNRKENFFYDSYLEYLKSTGDIRSWTKHQSDERKKFMNAFPFGGRLKYFFNRTIAISLGFKYLSDQQNSDLSTQYTRNERDDTQYIELTNYMPYSISAKAYIPMLGIHILTTIKGPLMFEGYLTGGPMFVQCQYLSSWTYEWWIHGPDYDWLTFQSKGLIESNGSGTGIALELGGRLHYPIMKNLGIFLEGGYAYQVAKNISGEGREIIDSNNTSWDGRWSIKEEHISTPWGEIDLELPTNYWPNDSNEGKARNFKLDLSGFQLRLGLSLKF